MKFYAIALFSSALAVLIVVGSAEGRGASTGIEGGSTYVVIYRPGPAWLADKPLSEQPLREHGNYMLRMYVEGYLRMAGPLTDDSGGLVILQVTDLQQAESIVGNDPAVISGVFVYQIHPWRIVDWEQFLTSRQKPLLCRYLPCA